MGKTITEADILMSAAVSMDTDPLHLDQAIAAQPRVRGRIAHGMLSAVLGTQLPGPRSIDVSQSLTFKGPVRLGETVQALVEIIDLNPGKKRATLRTRCLVKEVVVIDGEACVLVPSRG